MRKLMIPALAAGLLCLSACDADFGDFERFSRDFHYSYPLNSGGRLTVETFNGSVEISGWDQNTIDISGTKFGPTQAAADALPVEIEHTADLADIRVVPPSDRRGRQGASLVIRVPRGVLLDRITSSNGHIYTSDGVGPARLRTSNAKIQVRDLKGNLDAQTSNATIDLMAIDGDVVVHTSNGKILVDRVTGTVDASSSNASIHADIGRADRPVRAETSNGSIELTIPGNYRGDLRAHTNNAGITVNVLGDLNAHVVAHTSNSHISSDFEMRTQGELNKNSLDAQVGSGGGLLDLTTSNGGIRLVRM
jgi:DUF4097 and DUF4098 domain-containing protein YvlB